MFMIHTLAPLDFYRNHRNEIGVSWRNWTDIK